MLPEVVIEPTGRDKRATEARQLLPEDFHYRASTLLHFALRPRECFLAAGDRTGAVELARAVDGALPGSSEDGHIDLAHGADDVYEADEWDIPADEDGNLELLPDARKVEAISVNYDRKAKHVDVKELKTLLWREMEAQRGSSALSFQSLLDGIPPVSAAGPVENVSVHTCFICVLHLANEHGLRVRGGPSLATLDIRREAS